MGVKNLITALNCVLPVMIYMMLGYVAKLRGKLKEEICPSLNRFIYRFLLPINLFSSVYNADFHTGSGFGCVIFLVVFEFIAFLLAFPVARRLVPDLKRRPLYLQLAYRSNIGIRGIALAENLLDKDGVGTMALALAFVAPLNNFLAVFDYEIRRGGKVSILHAARNILLNPLILGGMAGIACNLLAVPFPGAVRSAVSPFPPQPPRSRLSYWGHPFIFLI